MIEGIANGSEIGREGNGPRIMAVADRAGLPLAVSFANALSLGAAQHVRQVAIRGAWHGASR